MSEQQPEEETTGSTEPKGDAVPGEITDEDLPEDLQPSEENPLARHPDQTGDDEDKIGADTDREPETAPMTEDEGDYGEKSD